MSVYYYVGGIVTGIFFGILIDRFYLVTTDKLKDDVSGEQDE